MNPIARCFEKEYSNTQLRSEETNIECTGSQFFGFVGMNTSEPPLMQRSPLLPLALNRILIVEHIWKQYQACNCSADTPGNATADWIVRLMMHFIVVDTSEKFMFGPMTSSSGEFLRRRHPAETLHIFQGYCQNVTYFCSCCPTIHQFWWKRSENFSTFNLLWKITRSPRFSNFLRFNNENYSFSEICFSKS